MSGLACPEGRCTLRVTHHGMSEPSAAAWELASPSQRLSGHVSHHAGWPVSLMSKGSEGACTPSGVSYIPTDRFHATVSAGNGPKVSPSLGQRWASGCLGMAPSCSSTSENNAVINSSVAMWLSSRGKDVALPLRVEESFDHIKPKNVHLVVLTVL